MSTSSAASLKKSAVLTLCPRTAWPRERRPSVRASRRFWRRQAQQSWRRQSQDRRAVEHATWQISIECRNLARRMWRIYRPGPIPGDTYWRQEARLGRSRLALVTRNSSSRPSEARAGTAKRSMLQHATIPDKASPFRDDGGDDPVTVLLLLRLRLGGRSQPLDRPAAGQVRDLGRVTFLLRK